MLHQNTTWQRQQIDIWETASVNFLATGKCSFQSHLMNEYFEYFLWNRSYVKPKNTFNHHGVSIASGNGLVPSGSKPLPEPVLTGTYVAILCH